MYLDVAWLDFVDSYCTSRGRTGLPPRIPAKKTRYLSAMSARGYKLAQVLDVVSTNDMKHLPQDDHE